MKNPSKISHPLKNRKGTSQRSRVIEALQADAVPIDGKTLADRLYLIQEYARHIKYHEYLNDDTQGEYSLVDTWTSFFSDSLPFQLARLSKVSTEDLEEQFLLLHKELEAHPSKQSLESLLGFMYNQLIIPYNTLYKTVALADNNFQVPLLAILQNSFKEPLKCYIALYNASVTFFCVCKKDFTEYMEPPWLLRVKEIYALDACIQKSKKGKLEAFKHAADILSNLFYQILKGVQEIVDEAPNFIEESLRPLEQEMQQKHPAHLALLFSFLELFKHFQVNINELGKKHLDFFYQQVLKMIPKEAVADKAHLIFEVAKHLDAHLLPQDLLLNDGKDANRQDIQFGLDHELVIDKAQVKDLRTLSLHPAADSEGTYIEGVYMAPVANTADGKGRKFKENQPGNWPTLGSKFSKYIPENEEAYDQHPDARLGFVLSSSVLLLQEGSRTITIRLDLNEILPDGLTPAEVAAKLTLPKEKSVYYLTEKKYKECLGSLAGNDRLTASADAYLNAQLILEEQILIDKNALDDFFEVFDPVSCLPIFDDNDKIQITRCLEEKRVSSPSLFKIQFSGEEEWLIPEQEWITSTVTPIGSGQRFEIIIVLPANFPAVVFYDEKVLQEKLDLKSSFPLVKIEINEAVRIPCDPIKGDETKCCLKNQSAQYELWVSPYHFLKDAVLTNAVIDVEVCGVKNLIVQNDDNLQDVNKPIMPFGPRPKVGAAWNTDKGSNFYIGSKEVFCKNWGKLWINTTWKDKPDDLHEHYRFYRGDNFENGDIALTDCSFRFVTSYLDQGVWIKDDHNKTQPPPASLVAVGNPSNHWDDNYNSDYVAEEYLALFKDSIEDAAIAEEENPCENNRPTNTKEDRYAHKLKKEYFQNYTYDPKSMPQADLEPLSVNSRKGFVRLTLAGASFQHERFTYVLARQMMALANLLDPESIELVKNDLELLKLLSSHSKTLMNSILSEVNFVIGHVNAVHNTSIPAILALAQSIDGHLSFINANYDINPVASKARVLQALLEVNSVIDEIGTAIIASTIVDELDHAQGDLDQIKGFIQDNPPADPNGISDDNVNNNLNSFGLQIILVDMERRIIRVINTLDVANVGGLPIEPYTPLIKSLVLDYQATAEKDDMEIVHLYPFENTSKSEDIEQNPTLFPYFDDQGTLFIGIEELTPGGMLSLLFQLAEATADSEQKRAKINWHYLSNNEWIELETGFDVISDETDGLTVSGIVTIAVPDAITKIGNTVMPEGIYWLKASAQQYIKAVAETIGIHTQAAKASARLSETNDTARLETALEAGSIGKLVVGDFSVKKVEQLYPGFGGRKSEAEGHFYTRVSEHLKHKGRAQLLSDYEKIVLEGFPGIYKVKCISHTMGLSANEYRRDLEVAPGYIIIAVIPDLEKLKAGNTLEPKAPLSLLEKIGDHLRKKTSAFARLKVMNPRYEFVNVCVAIRLHRGKAENFYAKKLKEDITHFLAPWFVGDTDKLAFGQQVNFSDMVGFIEALEYIDYIVELRLEGECNQTGSVINPLSARSILTAGEICVEIDEEECFKTEGVRAFQNQ